MGLAHVHFEDRSGRQLPMRQQLTRDEAREIANNIAKIPDLLGQIGVLQTAAALDTPVSSSLSEPRFVTK